MMRACGVCCAVSVLVVLGACVQRSKTFTAFPAPSVTMNPDLHPTQNPTPVTPAHIYGPTNGIALGQTYRPINSQPTH